MHPSEPENSLAPHPTPLDLAEYSADILCVLDESLHVTHVNRAVEEILGLSPDEVVGKNVFTLIHPDDRAHSTLLLQSLLARAKRRIGSRVRARHRDGSWRLLDARSMNELDNGAVRGIVVSARDVTAQVNAEIALRHSEQHFREVAENVPSVIWLVERHPRHVLYVSPSYERLWGRSLDGIQDNPLDWLESLHPDDRDRVAAAALADPYEPYDVEYRLVRADGIRWIQQRSFAIRDENGEICRIAGVCDDITERKQLQEQLLLAQKMESVGRLAGGIAHDFNNLLTVIMGSTEMAASDLPPDHGSAPLLADVQTAAMRAADLTRQLLAFARKQMIAPKIVQPNDIVREVIALVQPLFGVAFHVSARLHPDAGCVRVDPGQMEQVLLNLALNSRDAMPTGGEIAFSADPLDLEAPEWRSGVNVPAGRYVHITVADTGTGMTPPVRERMFEPFFTTKPVGKGTGLGLAMCYGSVKQNGGYIWADSQPGEGTRLHILLPRVCERTGGACRPGESCEQSSGQTILVLDDDPLDRSMIVQTLRGAGYQVLEATNGAEAARVLSLSPTVHLLLANSGVPGNGAVEFAHNLMREQPEARVVFMGTAGSAEPPRPSLLKPFAPSTLLCRLRSALDGSDAG